ncbi:hypothetical protein [Teichococcus wenyumeiae]|nr:hypothetical protein [Pseudoroseomonas wenyumeiae]
MQVLGYLERGAGLVPGKRLPDRSFDALRMNLLVQGATPWCRNG